MIRLLIGLSSLLTIIIFSNNKKRTYLTSNKPTQLNIEAPDWSNDTTLNYKKKKYLEKLYANSSN
jgi:hypothetical protein